jgi:tetratricopeptide (TPR) repeat protein
MRVAPTILMLGGLLAALVPLTRPEAVRATGTELVKEPLVDPAPCTAAATSRDDERIIAACGVLVDNDRTQRADRVAALTARAAAFARTDMVDRAIGDYDALLRLEPQLADAYNARGELWRRKGERARALRDFGAAVKLNPDHAVARSNYQSLSLELERIGALMAVAGKPSFNCAAARRKVEKAICASPELADLDREINALNTKVVREAGSSDPRAGRVLQREQDEFIARRNASFGQAGYDLRGALRERLDHLQAIDRK